MRICLFVNLFFLSVVLYPQDYKNKLYGISDGNKQYYVNILGEHITGTTYEKCDNYYCSYEKNAVVQRNKLLGIIDIYGHEIVPCEYDEVFHLQDNMWRLHKNNRCGILNVETGEWIVPLELEESYNIIIDNKILLCKKNGRWGAIDLQTKITHIPFIYTDFTDYFEDERLIAACLNDNSRGFINADGKVIIPLKHNEGWFFRNDGHTILKESSNGTWFIYNKIGKKIKIGIYDDIGPSFNNRISVKKDGLYGFCDSETGEIVIPCIYNDVMPFKEEVTFVSKEGRDYALLSKKGKILTDFKYKKNCFEGALCTVYSDEEEKYGVLNKEGKVVIPFVYDELWSFNTDGYCIFGKDGMYGILDTNNNIIIPAEYEHLIMGDSGSLIAAKKNHKYGYINYKNNIIVPFEFDNAWGFGENELFAEFEKKGKRGYIDRNGIIVCDDEENTKFKLDQYCYAKTPSDVDKDIPISSVKYNNTFAVIISNEIYSEDNIPDAQYAEKDGNIFKDYCSKVLGLSNRNIRHIPNATLNQIRSAINWVGDVAKAYNGNIIFYYAGHGIPDESNASSYLLPSDGLGNDVRSAYSLKELYAQLSSLPAKQITVFIDACFCGSQRNGKMLTSSRAVVIKAKQEIPKGNMIVFSASQNDETAYLYKWEKHGLFTYFLLKKMKESSGNVSLGELFNYVKDNVSKYSIFENGKIQTPSVSVSTSLEKNWMSLKLK